MALPDSPPAPLLPRYLSLPSAPATDADTAPCRSAADPDRPWLADMEAYRASARRNCESSPTKVTHHRRHRPQPLAKLFPARYATIGVLPRSKKQMLQVPPRYVPAVLPLLPPQRDDRPARPTVVFDLDETLIRSSFEPSECSDYVVPLETSLGPTARIYVQKRPGVDKLLELAAEWYEVVVFTASQRPYAEAVLNALDRARCVKYRLFRDSCSVVGSGFVKDLRHLGRDLARTVIVDNSPMAYSLQPGNALPVTTWVGDTEDKELYECIDILDKARCLPDLRYCRV